MVSIGMVVLNVADMGRAVGFWSQALGYEVREGGAGAEWSSLTPAGGLGTGLGLQLSTTVPEKHPRVHLDLYAADAAEQAAEAGGWCPSAPSVSTGTSTRRTPTSSSCPIPTGTGSASSTPATATSEFGKAPGPAPVERQVRARVLCAQWCLGPGEPASLLPAGFDVIGVQDVPDNERGIKRRLLARRGPAPGPASG